MSSLVKRILLFVIVTPLFGVIILFLTYKNHLILNLIITASSIYCTYEAMQFFRARGLCGRGYIVLVTAGLLPVLTYLELAGLVHVNLVYPVFILSAVLLLAKEVFTRKDSHLEEILPRTAANMFLLVYPGLFFTYVIRISGLPAPASYLVVFFLMIFLNDAAAYVFGMLFGKRNRPLTPISPNKTMAGFIGGFLTSIGVAVVARAILPDYIALSYPAMILLGGCTGFMCITGDLIESGLKRSARVKDSGDLIPGRGGVLDSLDSLLFSAPVYYFLVSLLLQ